MKIYSNAPSNVAYIENVCEAYTGALVASNTGDLISIYHTGLNIYEISNVDYHNIQDVNGNGFSSAAQVLIYLQSLFVVTASTAVTFNFPTPQNTWTINHNFGYYPSAKIYSNGAAEIEGDVLNVSANQLQVNFSTPTAGFARLL